MAKESRTHFGYEEIPVDEKQARVRAVFDSVANRYDLMNDLMSFGIHRLWKRRAIELAGVKRGQRVLDLASGTGDLAARFSSIVGSQGLVVMSDINEAMLCQGRERLDSLGRVGNLEYVLANAESLPFPENHFDCITISFGLRNVTNKQQALQEMQRVLRPGGKALILEFSHPTVMPLRHAYDLYSFSVLPLLGRFVVGDAKSYRYLAESIRMHPNQAALLSMMEDAGFERCQYFNLTGGIIAIHRGYKY
jgi:demethylmenaquinone methyltransferase/2-methoxy-6-polyprenyl-1,4-benzoquinol methylase